MKTGLYIISLLCVFTSCQESKSKSGGGSAQNQEVSGNKTSQLESEGKTYLYKEFSEKEDVESDFSKSMNAFMDSLTTAQGGTIPTKEELEYLDRQLYDRYKLVVDHFNSDIVYDADYNAIYHFTVVNRVDQPIIAFEMGYNHPYIDGSVVSVKRFKQKIDPNYAFDGQLSMKDVPEGVTFYAISLITEDGVKHDIHQNLEFEKQRFRRKYSQ